MSIGQSVLPNVDRSSEKRFIGEHARRIEALERQKPPLTSASLFGSSRQSIPLQYFGSGAPNLEDASDGFAWVSDPTSFGGGYAEATTDGAYFSGLVLLEPRGSVWQFNNRHATGPDFGRFRVALASLLYESDLRSSGDPAGKIQDVTGAYGSFNYVELTVGAGFDCYSAAPVGDEADGNSLPFIIGGEIGDPLTAFNALGNDPFLGFQIANGGPGWYRMKIYVDGNVAPSSGHIVRISDAILTRRSDENAF